MTEKTRGVKFTAIFLAFAMLIALLPTTALAASEWQIASDTEIYWVETADANISNADLKAQIQLFSQEMQAKGLTSTTLPISYGKQELAGDHDIVLLLDASLNIAAEGYQILISGGQLLVKASDADGLFYGCRFVEQALLTRTGLNKANGVTVKPDYPERAFFLDCGRKYYSPDWIKDMIREISWSNMNAIYIHFSEEMGFRLESKTYPWLAGGDNTLCIGGASYGVAADNGKYITQDEMREIAAVAKLYHVEIIPSLDSPGHMNYAVKKYNAKYGTDIGNYYHYNGKTAIVQGSGPDAAQTNYSRGIDISNKEAVTFAKNLYAEYAAFFKELGCTKFDIGGDELLGWGTSLASVSKWKQLDHWKTYAQKRSGNSKAVAYDAFMYYMNDIYDLVKGYGYTSIRMWNDDALRTADTGWNKVVTLNPGMEIQYWTPTANNSKNNIWTYLNAGYKAYNFLNDYNYYVLGQAHDGTGYAGITPQRIYENWAPNIFIPYGGTGPNTVIGNANVKGSAFCVWCDKPSTESASTVKAGILPCIRVNGAKAWDADLNKTVSYSSAQQLLKLIGDAPTNLPAAPEVKQYVAPDMTALKAVIAEYEATDAALYTELSFEKYAAAVNSGRAVLAAKKPTQADVDNAVSAIQTARAALELLVTVDFTALDEELSIFDSTNGADYTEETYTAYKVYAETARELRSSSDPTQDEIDAAANRLAYLRSQLRAADKVADDKDENWFLSLAVKSKKALQGKLFTFTAYVRLDANIVAYEVYDENGQRVDPKDVTFMNKAYMKGNKDGVQIRINAEVKGEHTYTFYAVNADGVRSPDSRSITVIVR